LLERYTAIPGLGRRQRLLDELTVPTVTLFKEMNEATVGSLLGRAGAKITRELRAEYPSAGIERVVVGKDDPMLEGSCVGTSEHATIAARAKALWDHEGESIADRRL
jgi:hypothetical protein